MRPLLVLLPLVALLAGCHMRGHESEGPAAGGGIANRDFAASGFDRVASRGPDEVIVRVGGPMSVHAEGDRAVVDRLKVEVVDGELRVGRESGMSGVEIGSRNHATITVTLPALKGVALVGSGDMKVDRVAAEAFAAELSGSGDLTIAALAARKADFAVSGSGDVTVAGKTDAATFSLAGSGGIDAAKLENDAATISVAGSGNVEAVAHGAVPVSIMGSGDVTVRGTTQCTVTRIGSGEVKCAG